MPAEVFTINMEENKKEEIGKSYKKNIITYSVLGIVILGFGYLYVLPKYQDWKFNKELRELTKEINKPYLEDVYGGKTPKETLELFVAAVEKGDFELASKYFVLDKQEEWKERLVNGNTDNLKKWIDSLKNAQERGSLWDGNFQMEVKDESSEFNLVIDFVRYPKGIWKIKEI